MTYTQCEFLSPSIRSDYKSMLPFYFANIDLTDPFPKNLPLDDSSDPLHPTANLPELPDFDLSIEIKVSHVLCLVSICDEGAPPSSLWTIFVVVHVSD